MEKLVSIPEHSYYLDSLNINSAGKWDLHMKFVKFCRQKLELWMFIPCKLVDGVWVVLQEPASFKEWLDLKAKKMSFGSHYTESYCYEYQEAKDRVLFKGIEYVKAKLESHSSFLRISELGVINYPQFWENFTVEDLIKYNLHLTPTAKKQIGS